MAEISEGYAQLDHITLHYAEAGAGNDDLVIFLHGFPEFWYTWRKQLTVVGDNYHAVAPDLRGYNLSDKPQEQDQYRINHLIKDVLALARHFGHERFYLVAHDWGAAIAWSVALAKPELIKGLVILNGPHPYIFSKLLEENQIQIDHSKYITDFREEGIEQTLLTDDCAWLWEWTFKTHYENGQLSDDDRAAYIKAWTQPGAIRSALNLYRASPIRPRPKADGEAGLGLNPDDFIVKVPTMVLWGEKDHALVPENIDGIGDFVPDLRLIRLPDVTHWVTHEDPDRVNREVLQFFKDIETR